MLYKATVAVEEYLTCDYEYPLAFLEQSDNVLKFFWTCSHATIKQTSNDAFQRVEAE